MADLRLGLLASLPEVIQQLRVRATAKASVVHGIDHWQRVAWNGLTLARETTAVDRDVVLAFALFHDAMRADDGWDPDHGQRGARLARDVWDAVDGLGAAQLELLDVACRDHSRVATTAEPTLAACWDADRLDLWRIGRPIDPQRLSTAAARRPWPRHQPTWDEIAALYLDGAG